MVSAGSRLKRFALLWWTGLAGAAAWSLLRPVEETQVKLLAPREITQILPVYGRLIVRQTFERSGPGAIHEIRIPVVAAQVPEPQEVTIVIEGDGSEYTRRTVMVSGETSELRAPVRGPRSGARMYAVSLAAPQSRSENAPRVYRELAAEGYPRGILSVAGKTKPGNIALTAITRAPTVVAEVRRVRRAPAQLGTWLQHASLFVLAFAAPFLLSPYGVGGEKQRSPETRPEE